MTCTGCQKEVDMDTTGTCMSSHVNLENYNLDDKKACPDDFFYCPDCLNSEFFCKDCDELIPKKTQKEIGKNYK